MEQKFAKNLTAGLAAKGWELSDLAIYLRKIGRPVSLAALQSYQIGRRLPRSTALRDIAAALDTTMDAMLS